MEPILSATLPDTPVSISSNIIVGIWVKRAIMALRESMIRESSPPEAHFESSTGDVLLALKRKMTVSVPVDEGALSDSATSNTA